MSRVAAVLLFVLSALVGVVLPGSMSGSSSAAPTSAVARTWVVDAVDDVSGSRWESVDTGTSVVTVAVGDTVEWQFDRATQGHDVTSLAPSDQWESVWEPRLQEYRDPGGTPVRRTFERPGTYRYWCSLHGEAMSGTVVVVDPGGNAPPTAEPVVEPTSVAVGQAVHAIANAEDPDGDVVAISWDFGAGGAPAYADHAMHAYSAPGAYTVRLRVSDGRGGLLEQDVPITVSGEPEPTDPEPPVDDGSLPAIDAQASPGGAPLGVAFSTQVTTTGAVRPYADALAQDADLSGTAVLVRRRGRTYASLVVTGARPGARHPVHVHEQPCAVDRGGAHFRFDTTQPFAESNEIWPAFTADATGSSDLVEVTKPRRAGPLAVSVVVHDPANAARRIGCADLAPATAGLGYTWSFGDGTTGSGPDPDHTYAAPGTYTATVTVARTSGPHAGHGAVSDSVQVVVGGGAAPPPPAPSALHAPVDMTAPRISRVGPVRTVRSARPTITARVRDRDSAVRRTAIVLEVDRRRVTGTAYDPERGLVRWRPRRALAPGRHVVRLVVRDAAGNRAARTWRFRTP